LANYLDDRTLIIEKDQLTRLQQTLSMKMTIKKVWLSIQS